MIPFSHARHRSGSRGGKVVGDVCPVAPSGPRRHIYLRPKQIDLSLAVGGHFLRPHDLLILLNGNAQGERRRKDDVISGIPHVDGNVLKRRREPFPPDAEQAVASEEVVENPARSGV